MVNLVVRTALLDQLQGSHSTFGLMGSLQLLQLGSSDNQNDLSHVLGLKETSPCTVLCTALERMESLSIQISRVLIYFTCLDSFLFSVQTFVISGDSVLGRRKQVECI